MVFRMLYLILEQESSQSADGRSSLVVAVFREKQFILFERTCKQCQTLHPEPVCCNKRLTWEISWLKYSISVIRCKCAEA